MAISDLSCLISSRRFLIIPSSSAIRLSLASMSGMIIFYQIIRKTKSKKGVNGYNLFQHGSKSLTHVALIWFVLKCVNLLYRRLVAYSSIAVFRPRSLASRHPISPGIALRRYPTSTTGIACGVVISNPSTTLALRASCRSVLVSAGVRRLILCPRRGFGRRFRRRARCGSTGIRIYRYGLCVDSPSSDCGSDKNVV